MRIIKIIIAVLLFFTAFSLLITGIASFTDPEIGLTAGLVSLVLAAVSSWGGVKLVKKAQKTKPNVITEKPDFANEQREEKKEAELPLQISNKMSAKDTIIPEPSNAENNREESGIKNPRAEAIAIIEQVEQDRNLERL